MRASTLSTAVTLCVVAAACGRGDPTTPSGLRDVVTCDAPAPLIIPDVAPQYLIANQYIVTYTDNAMNPDSITSALSQQYGFAVQDRDRWSGKGLRGFAAELSDSTVAALRCIPAVRYVQQQQSVQQ